MLKNYCAFITFSERESAEEAMNALHNKLTIKVRIFSFIFQEEKYRLTWAKISNPDNLEDEHNEKAHNLLKTGIEEKQYRTECPLYESETINPVLTQANIRGNKPKTIYSLNLNNYDRGAKPYYPSMDPNAMGGELKYKSKKKIKAIINKEKEIVKESNNLGKLLKVYDDLEN